MRSLARIALSLAVCLSLSGCAGGPTFAELFDDSAGGEGTGFQGAALVRAVVILARHQATPRQREVARVNAERAIAKMEREIAAAPSKPVARKKSAPRKKTATAAAQPKPTQKKTAGAPAAAEPEPDIEPEPAPAKPAKQLPKRIAVRTLKDEKTAPGAEAAVMIYDVQARRIVGNEVYDIENEPPPGDTVKIDTSVVRYVGTTTY